MIHITNSVHHRKIPWLLILVFISLATGIGILGHLYYKKQKEHLKEKEQEELLAVATLKASQIQNWRHERLNDAAIFFKSPFIASQIQEFLGGQGPVRTGEDVTHWLASLQTSASYDRILLLDGKGKVRVSIPASTNLEGGSTESLVKEAMEKRKIVLSDLYRDEISHRIYLDLLVPLLIEQNRRTLFIGVLLFRNDPHQFLYPLLQSWPLPSRSAESLLIRREGDEVVFLNELRHRKNTPLALRLPVSEKENPAAMAVSGIEGVIEGVDYRGVKVLAAVKPIKDSPWFLIAKKDQEEVYEPIRERALYIIFLAGILILAVGLAAGLLWRQQVARIYREQYETELERRALEKHYRYLTQYANDIIVLYDHRLRIVEVNDRAVASYGYSREELLRMDAASLRPAESQVELQEHVKKVEEQKGYVFETIHQRRDGTTFPVEVSSRLIEVDGVKFLQNIIRDITERKKAEEEIRRTQIFLSSIIENIPDMILIKDARDLRFLHANRACEELTGISRVERIGKTVYDLFSREEAASFTADDRKTLEDKRVFDVPNEPMNTKHRGLRYLHTKKIPILDQEGAAQYLLTISEDITERKRVEEALRESEERFRDLYDNAPGGYYEYNTEGRITRINRTELEMLGYAHVEMINRPVWTFFVEQEASHQSELAKLAGALPPGRHLRRTLRRKDGTTFPVQIEDRLLKDEGGQIRGIRSTIQDITELIRAEEIRETLIHDLQEALLKVKTLSGLLPICASCKKIRDDKGYWNQIEAYVSERSEAEFSHCICPECARKLYPELYEDDKGQGEK